jgi:hypothetical protein
MHPQNRRGHNDTLRQSRKKRPISTMTATRGSSANRLDKSTRTRTRPMNARPQTRPQLPNTSSFINLWGMRCTIIDDSPRNPQNICEATANEIENGVENQKLVASRDDPTLVKKPRIYQRSISLPASLVNGIPADSKPLFWFLSSSSDPSFRPFGGHPGTETQRGSSSQPLAASDRLLLEKINVKIVRRSKSDDDGRLRMTPQFRPKCGPALPARPRNPMWYSSVSTSHMTGATTGWAHNTHDWAGFISANQKDFGNSLCPSKTAKQTPSVRSQVDKSDSDMARLSCKDPDWCTYRIESGGTATTYEYSSDEDDDKDDCGDNTSRVWGSLQGLHFV